MGISVLDMYTLGVGPSSSHTVGPMRAAFLFLEELKKKISLKKVKRIQVTLYGSLALTGKGHATDTAILMGLMGELPESIDPIQIPFLIEEVRSKGRLLLQGEEAVAFSESTDLLFEKRERLPLHSNGMRFAAYDSFANLIREQIYYSIGGGFVLTQEAFQEAFQEALRKETDGKERKVDSGQQRDLFSFVTMEELFSLQKEKGLLAFLWEREDRFRPREETQALCWKIWSAMRACVLRGIETEGLLPGGLGVQRRSAALWNHLQKNRGDLGPSEPMEWISLYALAVNEENAAGGRVVTAPTNGAAGVIPAVLHYLLFHEKRVDSCGEREAVEIFLLVAGAIGVLYKEGASISAAEMGCQGEIGVASSMAAGAYVAVMGGSVEQIEVAAEIAMEHHLGMTCDPVGGLVQIPCIERNTMGAVKAITAGRLALRSQPGQAKVSLDQVIRTMLQTGKDMHDMYKETSLGGLAVNVVAC